MWYYLRRRQILGLRFRRQAPIGNFIVDFVCYEAKLIIELDGGQHNQDDIHFYDTQRSAWLQKEGFKILGFWNHEVLNQIENVLETIMQQLSPS